MVPKLAERQLVQPTARSSGQAQRGLWEPQLVQPREQAQQGLPKPQLVQPTERLWVRVEPRLQEQQSAQLTGWSSVELGRREQQPVQPATVMSVPGRLAIPDAANAECSLPSQGVIGLD